jgi:uncharacterized protein involved in cysteine biosynthesis
MMVDKIDNGWECPSYPTCVYRLEILEAKVATLERKWEKITLMLVANLVGVILTLVGVIGAISVYMAKI